MPIAVSSRPTPDVTASPTRDRADPARTVAPKAPRPASAMGEFIRVSRRILSATRLAPIYARDAVKAMKVFAEPGRFLSAYIVGRPLDGQVVRLRSGFEIETSTSASDFATLMVVLVRQDYGPIPRGGVVVDVGANIGAFMLYAILGGASRVISFEPSREAFSVLGRNVERNQLADRVIVRQLAVSGVGGSTVWFPTTSSPSNRIVDHAPAEGGLSGHEEVSTTSVAEIVDTHGDVDLLKLDCEGAEYDIVAATKPDAWSRIRAVCIEYHKGRTEALIAPLVSAGFHLKHHARDARWPDDIGMLHFARG